MIRRLALGLLLALAACNRHGAADVTLEAEAAQRNATAARTAADLAAADAASRGPVPVVRDAPPAKTETPSTLSEPAGEANPAPAIDEPDVPLSNAEAAPPADGR